MANRPQPKISPQPKRQGNRSNHLNLVVNAPTPGGKRSPFVAIAVLMISAVVGYAWIVGQAYFSAPAGWSASGAAASLLPAFKSQGIEGYLVAKARLREQVRQQLRNAPESDLRAEAENLAVYLFAELLEDSHFEKVEGQSLFVPLVNTIEEQPRTEKAKTAFENLRAEIWNYETASREEPQVTEVANNLLQLFEEMSK